jgi:hypothetical protein
MFGVTAMTLMTASAVGAIGSDRSVALAVTMSNDADANEIRVYDTTTNALVQTLSTQGKGGVGGNAQGVRQLNGEVVAVVNNGSNSVTVFKRVGNRLRFDRLVTTTSAPVSIDFGNDHMYVAGATTVDSFVMHHESVGWMDGSAPLVLVGGAAPASGSTAQVGVVNDQQLLVTLKTDPDPGTVDIVQLRDGVVTGIAPVAVSAPAGTLTPFGFSVYPDGTAVITLAHSNHNGLFRDGAFVSTVPAGQAAPCWSTRAGKYVFTANTGSKTITRLTATGSHIFVDSLVAAPVVASGSPSDIDANGGVLGVISRGGGQSYLSLFTYNRFGELTPSGSPIFVGVLNANGVAIVR